MEETAKPKRKTFRNFFYNFISQVLTLAIPLITTPYLSRILEDEGNGQYSYSYSIITYFVIFANLGLDVYGQRQIASFQNDKEKVSKTFWEISIIKIVLTSIALAILYSIAFTISYGSNYNDLIIILSLQVVFVPFDIQFLFKGLEKFRTIALRSLFVRIIGMICIFLFVKTRDDLLLYSLYMSLSVVISYLLMWININRVITLINPKKLEFKKHIKPALLIFLPTLAVIIYAVFDKTMIGLLANNPDHENGCYEQAYKLNGAILLFVTVISPVLISRNSNEYKVNGINGVKNNLYLASNYVFFVGIPLIVGTNIVATNLCSWFLGEGYDEVPLLMGIMSVRFIATGFTEIFGNQLFVAIGKEKYVTIAHTSAAILNISLNFVLIPYLGAIGAAITTAVSELLVTFILCYVACKKDYYSLKQVIPMPIKYLIGSILMAIPVFLINNYLPFSVLSFLLCTIVGVIIYAASCYLLKDKLFYKYIYNFIHRKKENYSEDEIINDNN